LLQNIELTLNWLGHTPNEEIVAPSTACLFGWWLMAGAGLF
jgi:hypothetical protein